MLTAVHAEDGCSRLDPWIKNSWSMTGSHQSMSTIILLYLAHCIGFLKTINNKFEEKKIKLNWLWYLSVCLFDWGAFVFPVLPDHPCVCGDCNDSTVVRADRFTIGPAVIPVHLRADFKNNQTTKQPNNYIWTNRKQVKFCFCLPIGPNKNCLVVLLFDCF